MSSQGRKTRFGACALVTILADGRWPRSRAAGWSSSSTAAWRPSVCSAATVIRLHGLLQRLFHILPLKLLHRLRLGLLHSLLHALVHSLLHGLGHSLLLGLLPRLQMRTTSRSLGCRHRRKGAHAGGVMTIEQQNQTVGTRAAISAGRTESAQHRRCPQRSQPFCCLGASSFRMMTSRYASLSKVNSASFPAELCLQVVRAFRTVGLAIYWQFKRMSDSSGLEVQAAIAC